MLMPQNLLREMTGRFILKLCAPIAFKKIKASVNYCLQIMSLCEDPERDSPDALSAALDVSSLFNVPNPIANLFTQSRCEALTRIPSQNLEAVFRSMSVADLKRLAASQ